MMLTCAESLLSECQQHWQTSSVAVCDGIVLKLRLLSNDFSSVLEASNEDPNLNPTILLHNYWISTTVSDSFLSNGNLNFSA